MAVVYGCCVSIDAGQLQDIAPVLAWRVGDLDLDVGSVLKLVLGQFGPAVPEEAVVLLPDNPREDCDWRQSYS